MSGTEHIPEPAPSRLLTSVHGTRQPVCDTSTHLHFPRRHRCQPRPAGAQTGRLSRTEHPQTRPLAPAHIGPRSLPSRDTPTRSHFPPGAGPTGPVSAACGGWWWRPRDHLGGRHGGVLDAGHSQNLCSSLNRWSPGPLNPRLTLPRRPPRWLTATTTRHVPLKLAQLAQPPLLPGPPIFVTNLRSHFRSLCSSRRLGRKLGRQVVTTATHHVPLKLAQKNHVRTFEACVPLSTWGSPGPSNPRLTLPHRPPRWLTPPPTTCR